MGPCQRGRGRGPGRRRTSDQRLSTIACCSGPHTSATRSSTPRTWWAVGGGGGRIGSHPRRGVSSGPHPFPSLPCPVHGLSARIRSPRGTHPEHRLPVGNGGSTSVGRLLIGGELQGTRRSSQRGGPGRLAAGGGGVTCLLEGGADGEGGHEAPLELRQHELAPQGPRRAPAAEGLLPPTRTPHNPTRRIPPPVCVGILNQSHRSRMGRRSDDGGPGASSQRARVFWSGPGRLRTRPYMNSTTHRPYAGCSKRHRCSKTWDGVQRVSTTRESTPLPLPNGPKGL